MNVVHVTHEAVEKIGGIGTVIDGLCTAKAYDKIAERTIMVGPLFRTDLPAGRRLGENSTLIYSSIDEIDTQKMGEKFAPIREEFGVEIVYGKREMTEPYLGKTVEVEVLLFEVSHANVDRVNEFKALMFEQFEVASDKNQAIWDYEQYVRIAEPAYCCLEAIGAICPEQHTLILSHEYMGMPTALKAISENNSNIRTVFYAHEVASVRPVVENAPGHDTMFYNVMDKAHGQGDKLEEIFPNVDENYKHELVKAARFCDHVFAVGDYVKQELEFVDPQFQDDKIDIVYNGVQSEEIPLAEKKHSQRLLKDYVRSLVGFEPDYIFTHVARPVRSKGIWRDLRVMHELEKKLKARGKRAVFIMLGTLGGKRELADVQHMSDSYGWPVVHVNGYPDLSGGEENVFADFESFNCNHTAVRALLVNQWGWSPEVCGNKMPAGMTIADLRKGADIEFGLSIYEPFGISQFEALSFGALCVVTKTCGCCGFAQKAQKGENIPNVIEADFITLPDELTIGELKNLTIPQRDEIERVEAGRLADVIDSYLASDENQLEKLLEDGYRLASRMSWEHVVSEYFLPAIKHTDQ